MAIDQRTVRVKCLTCGHLGTYLNGPSCLYCGAPLPPPGAASTESAPVAPPVSRTAAVSDGEIAEPSTGNPQSGRTADQDKDYASAPATLKTATPIPYVPSEPSAPPAQFPQPAPQAPYYRAVPWTAVQAPPKPKSRAGAVLKGIAAALLLLLLVGGVRLGVNAIASGALRQLSLAGHSNTPTGPWSNVVYSDSLKTDDGTWINQDGCQFKSDGYHVSQGYACYAPTGAYQDAQITATAKQDAGETVAFYGVVFRRTSSGNFYAFVISSDGSWGVQKFVDASATFVVQPAKAAAVHAGLGQANVLRVWMTGSQFVFFINGTQVGQLSDTTYMSGRVGVLGNSASGMDVIFSDFSVALP